MTENTQSQVVQEKQIIKSAVQTFLQNADIPQTTVVSPEKQAVIDKMNTILYSTASK